ncbi:C4-dicarboxylate ABC transporter substrate-binding protein [Ancylobacter pratisalsi]|uniref:C4-dicarboxylate ABC transporter substrate-binding protein n=1 Tax=Ancylobacter pratisalsi TaxID=1745854 RepID=A0A6P1YP73_9HYPH|nr:C4-dicarboxylate ABC transporter substrate-binding protein [Ancylobacter pratisalsi]QIB34531.1 C4-dicarboxylate ABC transporter substrate-binding protein [Ancylobacter pratisalsi]
MAALGPLNAAELSFAIGHPPQSPAVKGAQAFAATLSDETGGKVTAHVYALSLLNLAETSSGLRAGLADVGMVLTTYQSGEYPTINLLHDASMVLDRFSDLPRRLKGVAYAPALAEFILKRCPECIAEFAHQNQIYTGAAATTPYALSCVRPIRTMAELRGSRLRVGGANWARWAEAVQAVPITMAGNEMLEALAQGIIDCVVLSLPDVRGFGLSNSVHAVTVDIPGGVYVGAFANVNRDTWRSLTAAERSAVMKATAQGTAVANWAYSQGEQQVIEQIMAAGGEVYEADASMREASARFAEADLRRLAELYTAQGVARSQQILDEFLPILEQWALRVQQVSSAEQLADIYWEELYSTVDVSDPDR